MFLLTQALENRQFAIKESCNQTAHPQGNANQQPHGLASGIT